MANIIKGVVHIKKLTTAAAWKTINKKIKAGRVGNVFGVPKVFCFNRWGPSCSMVVVFRFWLAYLTDSEGGDNGFTLPESRLVVGSSPPSNALLGINGSGGIGVRVETVWPRVHQGCSAVVGGPCCPLLPTKHPVGESNPIKKPDLIIDQKTQWLVLFTHTGSTVFKYPWINTSFKLH